MSDGLTDRRSEPDENKLDELAEAVFTGLGRRRVEVAEKALGVNPKDAIGRAKPPMHHTPPSALLWMAYVFKCGADKYGLFNWAEGGVSWSVYYDAAMRHLLALLSGEDFDPDDGAPHEAHVMACMAILIDAREKGVLHDDRAEVPPAAVGPVMDKIRKLIAERQAPA